jgi:hypothetical protein
MADPGAAALALYRLVPRLFFAALFLFITLRQLWEREWYGAVVAGLLTLVLAAYIRRGWYGFRDATRAVPAVRRGA